MQQCFSLKLFFKLIFLWNVVYKFILICETAGLYLKHINKVFDHVSYQIKYFCWFKNLGIWIHKTFLWARGNLSPLRNNRLCSGKTDICIQENQNTYLCPFVQKSVWPMVHYSEIKFIIRKK